MDFGRGVQTLQQSTMKIGRHCWCESRKISTQVSKGAHAQGGDLTLLVKTHLGGSHVIAAMRVGEERFAAGGSPLDGTANLFGSPNHQCFFDVVENFATKTATYVGCDNLHFVFGDAEHESTHEQTGQVGVL